MHIPDKNIIVLTEVESTNNYANQLLLSKAAEEGTVVMSHYQKKGRGQLGNSWESEPGKNLLASFILTPHFLPAAKQFYISKIISLAIVETLTGLLPNKIEVKWPNDIYVGDRKIAGILIENSIKGRNLDWSVVGVGLNVNQTNFISDAPNPVSIAQLTGSDVDIAEVINKLFDLFFDWYQQLKIGQFSLIDERYFSKLYRNGGWFLFQKKDKKFEARIIGIGEFGQLRLKNRAGQVSEYMFKEIEFVL